MDDLAFIICGRRREQFKISKFSGELGSKTHKLIEDNFHSMAVQLTTDLSIDSLSMSLVLLLGNHDVLWLTKDGSDTASVTPSHFHLSLALHFVFLFGMRVSWAFTSSASSSTSEVKFHSGAK